MKNSLAFLLLLAACGSSVGSHPTPDGASPGTVSSADAGEPLAPTLLSTTPVNGTTGISFSTDISLTFSTDMDPASTIAAVTVAPSVTCTGSVSGATYTCAHAALLPSTQYTVVVKGTATSTMGVPLGAEQSISFTTGAAGVTSLVVAGQATNELRQGKGLASIMLTGAGLAGVTAATVGSLPATIVTAEDSTLALTVLVPHGLVPGPLDLTLVAPGGNIVVPHALVLSPIHAAAGTGDDTAAGTTSAPYATLRQALAVAGSGDTVTLADGTYSAGETWPAALPPTFVNVPDGVSVVGASTAGTILTPVAGSSTSLDGLVLAGNTSVTNLSIHGFQRGVVVRSGTADLESVHIYGNSLDGVYAMNDAFFGIGASEIDANANTGLFGTDTSYLLVAASTLVHDNGTGAYVNGSAHLEANDGARFDSNGTSAAPTSSGVYITGAATANLIVGATGNLAAGIYSDSTMSINVEGGANGNGLAPTCNGHNPVCSGLVIAGSGRASVSGEYSSNVTAGVAVIGPPTGVTLTDVTLHANIANVWLTPTGTLLSEISITGSTLSDASIGIFYGNFVNLSVQSTTITGDASADLDSIVTQPSSTNTIVDCSFGSDAAPARFPAQTGTVTESTQVGSVPNGPSWMVESGSVAGAAFVLKHS
jgi:hypothetical protein